MTLDNRFTIVKTKKEHLSGMNIQRGVFLGFLSDLTLFLENDSLYEHGVIFRLLHKL